MSPAGDDPILGPDGQPLRPDRAEAAEAAEAADQAGQADAPPLPEVSLTLHVFHLASQVAMALGEAENPLTGERATDLRAARFLIDTLVMLEEKTQGNRTPEEDEYLGGVLTNLRMAFVKKSG